MSVGDPVAAFIAQRGRLFGLAYRLLGSAVDAEDVSQEAFLRWSGADTPGGTVPGRRPRRRPGPARIDGHPLRMSCQAAIPLGTHAAQTVLHLIAGNTPKPVRPRFTGQCISRAAAVGKELVWASTVRFGLDPGTARFALSWS